MTPMFVIPRSDRGQAFQILTSPWIPE